MYRIISGHPQTVRSNTKSAKGGTILRGKLAQLKKRGQGLVEYALILVLIAIVVIVILGFLGQQVNTVFSNIGSAIQP